MINLDLKVNEILEKYNNILNKNQSDKYSNLYIRMANKETDVKNIIDIQRKLHSPGEFSTIIDELKLNINNKKIDSKTYSIDTPYSNIRSQVIDEEVGMNFIIVQEKQPVGYGFTLKPKDGYNFDFKNPNGTIDKVEYSWLEKQAHVWGIGILIRGKGYYYFRRSIRDWL